MKKNIALLLGLVLGLGFVSCSSDDDNDDEYTNGEGKYLAERIVTRYDWKDGKRSSEGTPYYIYRFNEKGQTISIEYPFYGHRIEVTHDEKGREIENNYDLSNNLLYKYISERNSFGRDSIRYRYSGERLTETVEYEYDNNRRVIKETDTYYGGIDGNRKTGTVYTYGYGEKADTIYFYHLNDDSFFRKNINEHESNDGRSRTTVVYANGDTDVLEYEQEYDSKGRITKSVGPIFAGGVDPTRYAATQYVDFSYNEDGSPYILHYKIPSQNEEYDLEYTYKYKKK